MNLTLLQYDKAVFCGRVQNSTNMLACKASTKMMHYNTYTLDPYGTVI